jgi:hypothetical protein
LSGFLAAGSLRSAARSVGQPFLAIQTFHREARSESLVWRYRQQIGGQSTQIPCACHPKNAVRLSASLTVPKLFKVHTVHIGTLVSRCVSRTVMFRSGSQRVADGDCQMLPILCKQYCCSGWILYCRRNVFTVRYELYYSYELTALEGFINAGPLIPAQ